MKRLIIAFVTVSCLPIVCVAEAVAKPVLDKQTPLELKFPMPIIIESGDGQTPSPAFTAFTSPGVSAPTSTDVVPAVPAALSPEAAPKSATSIPGAGSQIQRTEISNTFSNVAPKAAPPIQAAYSEPPHWFSASVQFLIHFFNF